MMTTDPRGVRASRTNPEAQASFEAALVRFQSYFGDPVECLDEAIASDPDFTLGHAFKTMALLLTTEAQYRPDALASLEQAESCARNATDRERAHVAAARLWCNGNWGQACQAWETLLAEHPRDILALQCAHLTDFLMGDANNLRQRVTRVLPAWDASVPGYGYVLGMHAFGLEECNLYAQAEDSGRHALAIEPRDPWAVHAVTHVMEMQGRSDEGIAWLEQRVPDWAPDNGFAFHNWWHLALFHLERLDYDKVLEIYDEQIYPDASDAAMALLDASALLWRLRLAGAPTQQRWAALAADWAAKSSLENGYYAFNDVHALMAYLAAEDRERASELLEALERTASDSARGDNRDMASQVGLPVALALMAFEEARYDEAIERLQAVRPVAHRFGGSHAQRDVLNLTLIEAARRAGRPQLVRHVLNERLAAKPGSPLAGAWCDRL